MQAIIFSLLMSLAFIAGLVYFVKTLWPLLPAWVAMLVFILLAVVVIGHPIYTLARWSNKSWQAKQQDRNK